MAEMGIQFFEAWRYDFNVLDKISKVSNISEAAQLVVASTGYVDAGAIQSVS